jgi:hypothetical protein
MRTRLILCIGFAAGLIGCVKKESAQPYLFRGGANDGFHESIGDTVNLSVTPAYLARIGLVPAMPPSREALIN